MAWAAQTDAGFEVETVGRNRRQPVDFDGLKLVAAPEAANNAAAQSALVPLLALGLPGSPVMAVLAGALMIHAVLPGPGFIAQNPDVFAALMPSQIISNIILVVLNLPFAGVCAALLRIPFRRLVL
jgi:TctA family transporter